MPLCFSTFLTRGELRDVAVGALRTLQNYGLSRGCARQEALQQPRKAGLLGLDIRG